jgi:hypothetical protein
VGVKEAVRRLGSHARLLCRWHRLMMASPSDSLPIFVPVMISRKPDMTDPLALPPPPAIIGIAWVVLEIMLLLQGASPSDGSSQSRLLS